MLSLFHFIKPYLYPTPFIMEKKAHCNLINSMGWKLLADGTTLASISPKKTRNHTKEEYWILNSRHSPHSFNLSTVLYISEFRVLFSFLFCSVSYQKNKRKEGKNHLVVSIACNTRWVIWNYFFFFFSVWRNDAWNSKKTNPLPPVRILRVWKGKRGSSKVWEGETRSELGQEDLRRLE